MFSSVSSFDPQTLCIRKKSKSVAKLLFHSDNMQLSGLEGPVHLETEKHSLAFPHRSKRHRVEPFTEQRCGFGAVAGQAVDLFYGLGGDLVEPFKSRFRVRSRNICTHTQPHSHVHFFPIVQNSSGS